MSISKLKFDSLIYFVYDVPFDYERIDRTGCKVRPAVLMGTVDEEDSKYGFLVTCIKITSEDNHYGEYRKRREFDVDIEDWEEAGLEHRSRIRLESIIHIEPDLICNKRGKLSHRDISEMIRIAKIRDRKSFDSPWNFMSWLKRNRIKNTIPKDGISVDNNLIQHLDDIKKSKRANCLDATLANHDICKRRGYMDKIVWLRWQIDYTTIHGHLFSMFTPNQNGYFSFQWVGDRGEVLDITRNWKDCIESSIIYMTNSNNELKGKKFNYYIFSDEDIEWIDDNPKVTQGEFLEHIYDHAIFEQYIESGLVMLQEFNRMKYSIY